MNKHTDLFFMPHPLRCFQLGPWPQPPHWFLTLRPEHLVVYCDEVMGPGTYRPFLASILSKKHNVSYTTSDNTTTQ